jgi:spermidine/putrescine transport system ATP-binding protein
MNGSAPLVRLEQVCKRYGDQDALTDICLDIYNGEFLTILGPSGCGKTTLLRLIAGFEPLSAGRIALNGRDVAGLPPEQREVNTVFQSYALFPHMTVFDNVAFGLRMRNQAPDKIHTRVSEALHLVQLAGFEGRRPHQLSGGQQQRVAVARAIVNRPLVLLLDEPLSALDYRLRKQMQMDLKHLQRRLGITFILVTHDQDEAFSMSDRVVVLNAGRIEQIGRPSEVYEQPRNLYVARFVGEINLLDGRVDQVDGERIVLQIDHLKVRVKSSRTFAKGEPVHVLLRPEDLRVETLKDLADNPALKNSFADGGYFLGTVQETIYKGATYDVAVLLDNGRPIMATEFFNAEDATVYFRPGDRVAVSWIEGWEVLLPHEG